jgi:teichoic acid transport system permease protein
MPPIRPYLADTLSHINFAYEKSKLDLRAANKNTWFGRLWNVLNPLLLGVVYWLLVIVIFGNQENLFDRDSMKVLTQILGGLFLFALPSGSLSLGARSIVGGGTFVMNTRLPRMILPIGAVISAFLTFLPSLGVYAVFHLISGYPIGWQLLWIIPIVVIVGLISLGLALALATLNVYFRDIASFLPYVIRIWLYLTPIIYLYDNIPAKLQIFLNINPIGTIFAAWQEVLFKGTGPTMHFIAIGVAWAVVCVIGGTLMFLRRERDFAVRI